MEGVNVREWSTHHRWKTAWWTGDDRLSDTSDRLSGKRDKMGGKRDGGLIYDGRITGTKGPRAWHKRLRVKRRPRPLYYNQYNAIQTPVQVFAARPVVDETR